MTNDVVHPFVFESVV